ncbi:MAG: VWA domain-containing protein [candidate division KSB1 bacterium]|nr:VWA domain-containing protein [candidate division KSB1 bacterium]
MFRFYDTLLLHLLWMIPVLILFFVMVFRWKRRALQRFGNLELVEKLTASTSRGRQILKVVILLFAITFTILSLGRPQIGTKLEEVKREGVDILVAMDVSLSMMAEDVKPNRLEKAKHEVGSFIEMLEGDRIGLIAFAGVPFVQCPLTLDYGAARLFLDIIDVDLIPTPGTAISQAIDLAIQTFEQRERKHKVLVLITDGEDHEEDPLKAAERAEMEGIVIYTVGVGSSKGVPIPVMNDRGFNTGFKKDRKGEVVTSKLDEITLEKVALQTNGKYFRATGGEDELRKIYNDIAGMEKKELASVKFSQYEDRFQYLLIVAILLLVVEVFIPEKKKLKREWKGRFI